MKTARCTTLLFVAFAVIACGERNEPKGPVGPDWPAFVEQFVEDWFVGPPDDGIRRRPQGVRRTLSGLERDGHLGRDGAAQVGRRGGEGV